MQYVGPLFVTFLWTRKVLDTLGRPRLQRQATLCEVDRYSLIILFSKGSQQILDLFAVFLYCIYSTWLEVFGHWTIRSSIVDWNCCCLVSTASRSILGRLALEKNWSQQELLACRIIIISVGAAIIRLLTQKQILHGFQEIDVSFPNLFGVSVEFVHRLFYFRFSQNMKDGMGTPIGIVGNIVVIVFLVLVFLVLSSLSPKTNLGWKGAICRSSSRSWSGRIPSTKTL